MVWRRGDDRLPARPFGVTFPDLARVTALTFDCYGTLIDWEAGAIEALRPLLARHGVTLPDNEIIQAFQDIDAELCESPYRTYRAVLAGVVEGFGRRFGFPVGVAERDLLAWSLPTWRSPSRIRSGCYARSRAATGSRAAGKSPPPLSPPPPGGPRGGARL